MSDVKTKVNDASVTDFINSLDDEVKRRDSLVLLDMFTRITGDTAKMWGTSIIGFGVYQQKSASTGRVDDWPLMAFSPRKQTLTLYVMPSFGHIDDLLGNLGKHKTSKACLYINKLDDVDLAVLEQIIHRTYEDAKQRYEH